MPIPAKYLADFFCPCWSSQTIEQPLLYITYSFLRLTKHEQEQNFSTLSYAENISIP